MSVADTGSGIAPQAAAVEIRLVIIALMFEDVDSSIMLEIRLLNFY